MSPELNKLILNRYIISRHLASGGMADVYEAQDVVIDKIVALKFLKPIYSESDDHIRLFKNEARFNGMFNHPHIMKIYNVGEIDHQLFASYEMIKGKTLKEVLDSRGNLSIDEAIDYMLQIIDAVSDIHFKEVLHNDLKPDNIFLLRDGNIKIGDLGIASHVGEKNDKEIIGSLNYLAPEVIVSKKYSYQSDIYSLGVILYEFLTGRYPFIGSDSKSIMEAHIKGELPSIKKYISLPNYEDFDLVLNKACNKNPSNRYKNVNEMASDINKIKRREKLKKESLFKRLFK